MAEDLKLTLKDRLILRNQFQILSKVDPDQAEVWEEAREIIENGYEGEYYSLTEWFSDPFTDADCREVREILDMHRMLDAVAREHPGSLKPDDVAFGGFDGNNEGRHLAYTKFLIEEQGRWQESRSADLNSHWPKLPDYREMLERWKASKSQYELSLDDARRIIGKQD